MVLCPGTTEGGGTLKETTLLKILHPIPIRLEYGYVIHMPKIGRDNSNYLSIFYKNSESIEKYPKIFNLRVSSNFMLTKNHKTPWRNFNVEYYTRL